MKTYKYNFSKRRKKVKPKHKNNNLMFCKKQTPGPLLNKKSRSMLKCCLAYLTSLTISWLVFLSLNIIKTDCRKRLSLTSKIPKCLPRKFLNLKVLLSLHTQVTYVKGNFPSVKSDLTKQKRRDYTPL